MRSKMQRETAGTVLCCLTGAGGPLKRRLNWHGTIKACCCRKPIFDWPEFPSKSVFSYPFKTNITGWVIDSPGIVFPCFGHIHFFAPDLQKAYVAGLFFDRKKIFNKNQKVMVECSLDFILAINVNESKYHGVRIVLLVSNIKLIRIFGDVTFIFRMAIGMLNITCIS